MIHPKRKNKPLIRGNNLFSFLILFTITSAFSQEKAEISLSDPLFGLIKTVTEQPGDSTESAMPEALLDIISEIYEEQHTSDSLSIEVLGFISDVYDQHGYHETGGWSALPNFIKYIPYTGELPDFEISDFVWPVKGKLNSGYGYRPKFKRVHRGIDLHLNLGDTVKSALPGVVIKNGYDHKGYGSYVVVAHSGNIETLYAHLSKSLVMPGVNIKAGEPIGLGGNTGNSTGTHLHFETRYLGMPMDPISWFNLSPEEPSKKSEKTK